jgi:hypothetical protein
MEARYCRGKGIDKGLKESKTVFDKASDLVQHALNHAK